MRLMGRFFDTIFIYMGIGIVCISCIPFFIIMCCLPRQKRFKSPFFHWSTYYFFKAIIFVSRIKVVYKGFEDALKEPVILVANHQSSLDIPLIGSAIRSFPLIWLARSELEESFLLRIALRCCAIVAEVKSAQQSALSLRKLFGLLKDGGSCPVIFPEGSRYDDGKIHDFFNGFAFLARETNRSVVPILIENAFQVYPRGAFLVNRTYVISVTRGPEFLISSGETLDEFGARVKTWFLQKANNSSS
jgi:1-acyl-sn-glycerol-3-phosphate acyltransferase